MEAHANRVRDTAHAMAGGGQRNIYQEEARLASTAWGAWTGVDARPKGWRSDFAKRVRVLVANAAKALKGQEQRTQKLLAFLQRGEVDIVRFVLRNALEADLADRYAQWAFDVDAAAAAPAPAAPAPAAAPSGGVNK